MFRIDFGSCILENIEELLLSMFLHAWTRACVRNLDSCVRGSNLAYAGLFLQFCVYGNGPAYARSYLRMWALTYVREMLGRSLTLPIFTYFSSVSLSYVILTPLLVIFAPISLYLSFLSLHENIIFPKFCLNQESNVIFFFFFLGSHHPFMLVGEALTRW